MKKLILLIQMMTPWRHIAQSAIIIIVLSANITNAQWQQTGLSGEIVHCIASDGTNIFAGTDYGIFLSTNNGGLWTAVNTGLQANTAVFSLATSGTNIFAGTWGGVFLSTNNGSSWTAVNTGLTNTYIRSLAISGTNLFAGAYGNGGGVGVWKRPLSDFVTGIESLENQEGIIIYPNPSSGKFTVSNKGVAIERCEVEIYNVLGEKVYSLTNPPIRQSTVIDISSQPNGVYFLKMQTDKVQEIQKLIIQK